MTLPAEVHVASPPLALRLRIMVRCVFARFGVVESEKARRRRIE